MRGTKRWMGYLASVVLMGVGLVVFALPLVEARREVALAVDALQRVVVPGGGEFVAADSGMVTVYYEKLGTFNGEAFATSAWMTPMRCVVRSVETSKPAAVTTPEQTVVYAVGERMGHAEWIVELPKAGRYIIDAQYEGEQPAERRLLAVGHVPSSAIHGGWGGVYGGAAVLAFLFSASVVVAITTWATGRPGRR